MGTKRIGLARVEALMENLKRDINWGTETTFTGLSKNRDRYYLEDYFPQMPGLTGDIDAAYTVEVARALSKNFEIVGTNMTSTLVTRSATRAAMTLTTAGADEDQAIVAPHLDAKQTAWSGVKWGTENQTEWECSITTSAAIDNQKIWAGLKLTNDSLCITDANSIWFVAQTDATNGSTLATSDNAAMATTGTNMLWHCIYSIGDAFYTTNLGLAVAASTNYNFKIVIDSDRKASVFVNGTQYGLVNDTGHTGGNLGTQNSAWGETNMLLNETTWASATSATETTLVVDTVDARGVFKADDYIYVVGTSVPVAQVKSVDSATQITVKSVDANLANNVEFFNYGQKAKSATAKSNALTDNIDFIPYIGIEAGDAVAAALDVHFEAINRILFE